MGPGNIGLLAGEPSGGLHDVDLDVQDAIDLASMFLPETSMVHGRPSKPRSHFWYETDRSSRVVKFKDVTDNGGMNGDTLIELRGTGGQTVIPPSTHPSGEVYEWSSIRRPAKVSLNDLERAVAELAACVLIARHWPSDGRHEFTLALEGFLLKGGLDQTAVTRVVQGAARYTGWHRWPEIANDVEGTAARLNAGDPTTGHGDLLEFFGEVHGRAITRKLSRFLGLKMVRNKGERQGSVHLLVTTLDSVEPEPVQWLWPDRIALRHFTVLAGDPGLGKSYLTLDIAARVSLGGKWPDGGDVPEGDVVIVTAEDALGDTVRPRLDRVGADVGRIHSIGIVVREGQKEVGLSLSDHLGEIEQVVTEKNAVLVVIDPILAFMGKRVDTHRMSQVRPVLARLGAMAGRTGCAIVVILHLNKNSDKPVPLYRLMDSIDFGAAARSVLLVAPNPHDSERRVLASVKTNLSAKPVSLGFYFTPDGVFVWDPNPIDLDAKDLLAVTTTVSEPGAQQEAEDFLKAELSEAPMTATEVLFHAKGAGISERTLRRAKSKLRVGSEKLADAWCWVMPDHPTDEPPRDLNVGNVGSLEASGALSTPTRGGSGKAAKDETTHGTLAGFGSLEERPARSDGEPVEVSKAANIATTTGDGTVKDEDVSYGEV